MPCTASTIGLCDETPPSRVTDVVASSQPDGSDMAPRPRFDDFLCCELVATSIERAALDTIQGRRNQHRTSSSATGTTVGSSAEAAGLPVHTRENQGHNLHALRLSLYKVMRQSDQNLYKNQDDKTEDAYLFIKKTSKPMGFYINC